MTDQCHLSAKPMLDSDKELYSSRLSASTHQYSYDNYSRYYQHLLRRRTVNFVHFVLQLTSFFTGHYEASALTYKSLWERLGFKDSKSNNC